MKPLGVPSKLTRCKRLVGKIKKEKEKEKRMPEEKDSNNKKEPLDLLGGAKKQSRRARQRDEASQVKTLDVKKQEALDIFSDEGKKKNSQVKKGSAKGLIAPISRKLEPVPEEDLETSGKEDNSTATSGAVSVSADKVISIKPPIIVSDVADTVSLKPFQ